MEKKYQKQLEKYGIDVYFNETTSCFIFQDKQSKQAEVWVTKNFVECVNFNKTKAPDKILIAYAGTA